MTWWHNGTSDPLLTVWQHAADAYHAAHPNVTIKVDPIQNEQFQTKVPLALQGSDFPTIYQQWGGGQEASQLSSGKVLDLSAATSGWVSQLGPAAAAWQVNGKQYGVPYDLHVVGFWYRKDLFAQAGITAPPATLDDLNADVAKLKSAGLAPISIGSKDRWPDAFWWEYFAVRECSLNTLKTQIPALKLTDGCWKRAGDDLTAFLATKPFQDSFLGTPAQQGAGSSAGLLANGKAAMELQGDWELGTMTSLTSDKNLASEVGWFPFPAVTGGQGDPGVALGGGDGFSCTVGAPAACADFLKYLDDQDVQSQIAAQGIGLPVNPAAASSLTDPALQSAFQYSHSASYIQTYFDIAMPTNVGQALDSAVADFFAGKGSTQSIIDSVSKASSGSDK
ncbi:extracellular solute-binding protein [Catenulispora yoronensis]|uniref:Extracellular solute-binding protein n=2 Tax=Catenulispora yoronensis TaxID=450799 RepID=A0ABP5FVJ4_9ACTN